MGDRGVQDTRGMVGNSKMTKQVSFIARRGEQPPKRVEFSINMKTKLGLLWSKIYTLLESNIDDSKYINPLTKENPYYRAGVNDGLRVALKLITQIWKGDAK